MASGCVVIYSSAVSSPRQIANMASSSVTGLAVVIMGVSGSGKSTVGEALAKSLNCSFLDADDFHSRANKEKMRRGMALSDEDRTPWLEALRSAARERISSGETVVLTCSALKRKYREMLRSADGQYKRGGNHSNCRVRFACLEAPSEVIAARMERRVRDGGHFMPVSLLKSQLDSLQMDDDEGIMRLDATSALHSIVSIIQANLRVDASCQGNCYT